MYNPPHFREDRVAVLHDLIREHGFGTLVTLGPDGLAADHIPMEIDPAAGPLGTLVGHVSRANPRRPGNEIRKPHSNVRDSHQSDQRLRNLKGKQPTLQPQSKGEH